MTRVLTCAVLVLFATVVQGRADDPKPKPVKPSKTWDGMAPLEARKEAPKDGFVADKEALEKLWKAFRPNEKVPDVDFTRSLLVVAVNEDPNIIKAFATLDAKGDLTVGHSTTEIAFTNPVTCNYQFALVPRDGVKSVNGKAIDKK
ncbi:MAG: hypothetical protein K2V38_16010 [Gemmataceae bacterium]|nr:hypothetical protein [Gemmataceae bacterium]